MFRLAIAGAITRSLAPLAASFLLQSADGTSMRTEAVGVGDRAAAPVGAGGCSKALVSGRVACWNAQNTCVSSLGLLAILVWCLVCLAGRAQAIGQRCTNTLWCGLRLRAVARLGPHCQGVDEKPPGAAGLGSAGLPTVRNVICDAGNGR